MMTNSDQSRLDRIEKLAESTQQQVEKNSNAIGWLIQIQLQQLERSAAELDSMRSTLERVDRVLSYLMARDGMASHTSTSDQGWSRLYSPSVPPV